MTDSRFLNAVIGAVVTLVLSFTGFSPVVGGAVAAWLEEGDKDESIRIGALSGVIAALPFLLLVPLVVFGAVGYRAAFVILGLVVVLLIGLFVGLSALGGYLAYYLLKDRRIPGQRSDEV